MGDGQWWVGDGCAMMMLVMEDVPCMALQSLHLTWNHAMKLQSLTGHEVAIVDQLLAHVLHPSHELGIIASIEIRDLRTCFCLLVTLLL